MSKVSPTKKVMDKDRYWNGVFTGVFIGCFFLCISILLIIRFQGLRVAVNPEQLAILVKTKVQTEAKKDIPRILEDIKKELPNEVYNHLEGLKGLDDLTIGFGQSQVKLPDEVIVGIKKEFNRIIEEAIINTLNNYNTIPYEERIGNDAYDMVKSIINQELIGKTYIIKTSQWLSVPIKIVNSNNSQFKIGI